MLPGEFKTANRAILKRIENPMVYTVEDRAILERLQRRQSVFLVLHSFILDSRDGRTMASLTRQHIK